MRTVGLILLPIVLPLMVLPGRSGRPAHYLAAALGAARRGRDRGGMDPCYALLSALAAFGILRYMFAIWPLLVLIGLCILLYPFRRFADAAEKRAELP